MRTSRSRASIIILYSLYLSFVMGNTFIVANSYGDTLNKAGSQAQDQNTSILLNKILEQVDISDTVKGRFEQHKYIHILPQPLISKGVFQLDKKTGLVWQITEPIASRIVFDSTGIHQSKNGQAVWEVSNKRPGVAIIGQLMQAALSYDWALLENHFAINGSIDEQVSQRQWALTLTPKADTLQQAIKHISLTGGQQLTQVILFEVNNDRTEINFDML